MALTISDRIKETTTTTGTGTYTLGGAVTGFETFTANLSNSDTTYYCCTDNSDFEVGLGTFTSSGTTLARTTILASSNSNNAVNWSSGTRTIFCTIPAVKSVILDASGNATLGGNLTVSGTFTLGTGATLTESELEQLDGITQGNVTASKAVVTNSSKDITGFRNLTTTGDVVVGGDLTVTGDDIIMGTNTSGHVLVADGTNYNPVAISGDVTIASNGAVTIAAGAVENSMLADDAVGADELASSAVVTASIVDANVTLAKIANQAANTVLVRDANSSGVVSAKAVTDTQILIGDGTGFTAAALSGDVTMTNAGVVTIGAGAVENSMLADDAVGADELAANAVVEASIVDNAVTLAKMAGIARGKLIVGNASGDPAVIGPGSANQVLTSDGTDIAFADPAGASSLAADNLTAGDAAVVLSTTSGTITIDNAANDADIIFKGTDGGADITALTLDMSAAGAATFNNDVTAFSDKRLKTDIKPITNGLNKVMQMQGVYYKRNDVENAKEQVGVLAQDMEQILPEVVLTADDDIQTKSVDYGKICSVLIEAIKELKNEIEELKAR